MKDLLKTNCFDIQETMIIVGSCLDRIQPKAYEELEKISSNIYDVCLEKEHLNMVVTKIIGMVARGKIKKFRKCYWYKQYRNNKLCCGR